MPRLAHNAVGAGRVGRAKNGPDVVRILDAVQDDDERRFARRGDEICDVVRRRVLQFARSRPGATPPRDARSSSAGRHGRMGTPARSAACDQVSEASARARGDAQLLDSAGAQRLENGVDAVDQHDGLAARLDAGRYSPDATAERYQPVRLDAMQRFAEGGRALAAADDRRQAGACGRVPRRDRSPARPDRAPGPPRGR